MKNRKAFTLVELLGVIVVLAIILAITIPSVSNLISDSTISSFKTDARMLIKTIEYKRLNDQDFDPTAVNESTLESLLGVPESNYEYVEVTVSGSGALCVFVIGDNKWDGLAVSGTYDNIQVLEMGGEPELVFKTNYGGSGEDMFMDMIETSSNVVVAGYSASTDADLAGLNKGGVDCIIVKYDADGNLIWGKNYGGSGTDQFNTIIETNGGYIAVGYSDSTNDDLAGLNKGSRDAIIVKYDSDGNIVWNKNFGGSGVDEFLNIIPVSGGYMAVGRASSTNGDLTGLNKGLYDAILVKYDSEGNVIWNKNFGGTSTEYFYSVASLSDGYIAAGYSMSTDIDVAGLNRGSYDAIIVKYDSEGNVIWNKNYGGTNQDYFYSVASLGDGYIALGSSQSTDVDLVGLNKGSTDAIIVKYDSDGNVVWNRNYGGGLYDYIYKVKKIGNVYIALCYTGSTDGDFFDIPNQIADSVIFRFDENGDYVWKQKFGGSNIDYMKGLGFTNSNYYISGYSDSTSGDLVGLTMHGGYDAIIVKYSSN